MAETWKILVFAVSLGTCLGAVARPAPATAQVPSVATEQSFDLMKERGRLHSLTPNAHHTYRVNLKAGQLLSATFQQLGLDIRLNLLGPAGEPLAVIDSPNGSHGQEPVLLVARRTGTYTIVVTTRESPQKDAVYVVGRARKGWATPRDRERADAVQSYFAARQLKEKGGRKWLQAYQAAATSMEKTGAPKDVRAYAARELGRICYELSLWEESARGHRRAAQLFRELGIPQEQAKELVDAGSAEGKIPNVDLALKHLGEALLLARANGYEPEEAAASCHLGLFYVDLRDAWHAKPDLDRAASLYGKLQDTEGEIAALRGSALLHKYLGEYDEALKIYQGVLQRLSPSPNDRAAVLTDWGNLYTRLGRPDKALDLLKQAFDIQKKNRDLRGQADTLNGFGRAYNRKGDLNNALNSYQKALVIYGTIKDPRSQAALFMNLGWLLGSLHRYDEATKSFGQAYVLIRELKQPTIEVAVLFGLAWIERLRGNLGGAIEKAEAALTRIESTRSDILDLENRLVYFSSLQDIYDFTVDVIMEQYHLRKSRDLLERALRVVEKARSRSLLDALGERQGAVAARLAPVLSTRQIQSQVLDTDTILLEYYVGASKSYLFLVTRNGIESFALPPRDELAARVKETYDALAASQPRGAHMLGIRKAKDLSKILLGPVAGRLGQKRLLIVPGEALQLVPFEILPDPEDPVQGVPPGLAWPAPLLLRHEVLLEPSASALVGIRTAKANQQPASGLLAVLADEVYGLDDPRLPGAAVKRGNRSKQFPGDAERLEASAREAAAIVAGLPPSKVLEALGFRANRDLVTSGRLRDYRILHIAAHAYFSFDNPALSALVLSRYDSLGRPLNGLLGIKDISSQDLREDLVVLSTCGSALGKGVRGEGIVGWPWAFLSAGASQVVMSFWNIGDDSTADLMQRFYKGMSRGMPSSLALREAQRQMWKEGKSPWSWGGFVAQGEWKVQPFSLNKTPPAVSSHDEDPRSPTMKRKTPPAKKPRSG
jgi:CHAT domain-containing protein/Tfp pilus assembly protein PilF